MLLITHTFLAVDPPGDLLIRPRKGLVRILWNMLLNSAAA